MEFLPIFLKSKGRRVVVIGGGVAAARKVDILLRSNCEITIYASELGEELEQLWQERKIHHVTHAVTAEDFNGVIVAIGATFGARLH